MTRPLYRSDIGTTRPHADFRLLPVSGRLCPCGLSIVLYQTLICKVDAALGLQSGDKESASSWHEFFKDLKKRGLPSHWVRLGIMDELSGLGRVFKEAFSKAKVQRSHETNGNRGG